MWVVSGVDGNRLSSVSGACGGVIPTCWKLLVIELSLVIVVIIVDVNGVLSARPVSAHVFSTFIS